MSQKQQVICLLLACFVLNAAAFSLQYKGNMKHPDLVDHCYYGEFDISIPFNGTAYPKNLPYTCIKVFCREDYVLEIKHCEKLAPNRVCDSTPYDYSKPYPECCPVLTCKND